MKKDHSSIQMLYKGLTKDQILSLRNEDILSGNLDSLLDKHSDQESNFEDDNSIEVIYKNLNIFLKKFYFNSIEVTDDEKVFLKYLQKDIQKRKTREIFSAFINADKKPYFIEQNEYESNDFLLENNQSESNIKFILRKKTFNALEQFFEYKQDKFLEDIPTEEFILILYKLYLKIIKNETKRTYYDVVLKIMFSRHMVGNKVIKSEEYHTLLYDIFRVFYFKGNEITKSLIDVTEYYETDNILFDMKQELLSADENTLNLSRLLKLEEDNYYDFFLKGLFTLEDKFFCKFIF